MVLLCLITADSLTPQGRLFRRFPFPLPGDETPAAAAKQRGHDLFPETLRMAHDGIARRSGHRAYRTRKQQRPNG